MRRFEVEISHNYDNKFVGSYKFKANKDKIILGSARDVNIRLLGDDISGIHAMLEYTDDGWVLVDLCSESGTWVRKKAILESPVKHETLCNIGNHVLKITPIEIKSDIFKIEARREISDQAGDELYHQVILKKSGYVIGTHLLLPNESFNYLVDGEAKKLNAPNSHLWVRNNFSDIEINQRLIKAEKIDESLQEKAKTLWDPNFKMPAIVSLVMFVLVFGLIAFYPTTDHSELDELKPIKNKYTRMIYDAKSTRKHREKSAKLKNKFVSKNQKQDKKVAKATKTKKIKTVVNISKNFKKAGLSKLIGKIALRASKTATFVQSKGSTVSTGRAFTNVSSSKLKTKTASSGKSYKLGAADSIQTGSQAQLKGIGGLATGSVGQANVGVIEEDTVIEGGLAREVIAQTIQDNIGQIRYCYERQLSANPDLYGKLSVKFVIGGNGLVQTQNIATSTMNSSLVEGCVLRRIAKWRFPKPKGGTTVRVTYPFLFKSSN